MDFQIMENKNRNILEHILNPTAKDMQIVRIFFWISIISCLLLPRHYENLAHNQTWTVICYIWLAFAVILRIVVQVRLTKSGGNG
jgi:hypothetical protein